MAKSIMIQGTMSNAGKSLLAAGLCRIFHQAGYRTAPFKSQNMALNSFITEEGLEMGRAQVVQAEAAGTKPRVDMNPILLKPTTEVGSQVIVGGIHRGNMKAGEYFAYKKSLIPDILAAYRRLEAEYDVIVIEGAGSPAEINLKEGDIVNMGLAAMVDAPVLLAGDIDRGGVFAQLYGTAALLAPEERARIKGLIINKFRGDKALLEPGIRQIEELCRIPVLGVVPYLDVDLEDEDSLIRKLCSGLAGNGLLSEERAGEGLLSEGRSAGSASADCAKRCMVDIAVIRFPRISNFTDFDAFSRLAGVTVRYVSAPRELGNPDMVVLPGTKNTIDDLLWMRQSGLEAMVLKLADRQVPVWGICGGYQMLGEEIYDEEGVESSSCRRVRGMGLLPLVTEFSQEKVRTQTEGAFGELDGCLGALSGMKLSGYEIHMGRTRISGSGRAADTARLRPDRQEPEICRPMAYTAPLGKKQFLAEGWNRGNVYGAYVHGIFDGPGIGEALAGALAARKGLDWEPEARMDYKAYREQQYDRLAQALRESLDMERLWGIMGLGF